MRYLAVAVLALLIAGTASSQGRFGAKAGIVLNYINSEGTGGGTFSNLHAGYTFGFTYGMPVTKNFAVQPELNFVRLNSDEAITNSTVKLGYVQTTVVLKAVTNAQNFSVYAGPQIGFLTKAESRDGAGKTNDITKQTTETQFDGVFGVEYITSLNITINARYTQGFSNVFKTTYDGAKSRNQYVSVTVGYLFGKKKS